MSPSFRIRLARATDLDALVQLEHATFDHDRVSRAQWRRHLRSESACVWVAEDDRGVAGSALVFFRRASRKARLYSIAIAQHVRGRGFGAALLEAAEREARARDCDAMALEVRTDNASAIALYEKQGYSRGERVRAFYENGADAWRYRKVLAFADDPQRPS